MNEDLNPDDTETRSTDNEMGSEPYAGAFFPRSRNFVVEGGVFTSRITNITHNHHTYPAPHDFRKIPMGDIDLQHEIQFDDNSGVVYLRRGQRRARRRYYSARIETCQTAKTVAWYQGPNAEQEWREDILMHSWIRHPNIVQLYGVASTNTMYAAVFHDDLIPFFEQAVDIHCNSPILSNYFRAYWAKEFDDVNKYLSSMFQRAVDEHGCTLWVRGSNHRLCVSDMILNDDTSHSYSYMKPIDHWRPGREETEIMSYNGPNHEAVAAFSLGLSQYHKILAHYSWPSTRNFIFPTHATVCIGMVLKCMADGELDDGELDDGELDQVELPVIIAVVPHLNGENSSGWHSMRYSWKGGSYIRSGCRDGHLMPNFWRRFNLHQIFHDQALPKHCKCMINCSFFLNCSELWLGQANHIFSSLHVTSEHYQYAVVDTVSFAWVLAPTTHSSLSSRGWLFVCPDSQLRSGPCSYRWPECAAYWSFDPFGAQRLSKEEAEDAGFPVIKLELKVSGSWWDASDYAGLWRFHEGKGFAPDSQEIARHLGHPLYQLCDELAVETPLADVSDEETETCQHPADTLGATSRGEAQTVHFDLGGENKTSRSIHAVSTGFNYAFKLPTSILVLVVLCCLFRTAE